MEKCVSPARAPLPPHLDDPPRDVQTPWSQMAFTERWGSSDQQTTQTAHTNAEADKRNVIFSKYPISSRCWLGTFGVSISLKPLPPAQSPPLSIMDNDIWRAVLDRGGPKATLKLLLLLFKNDWRSKSSYWTQHELLKYWGAHKTALDHHSISRTSDHASMNHHENELVLCTTNN